MKYYRNPDSLSESQKVVVSSLKTRFEAIPKSITKKMGDTAIVDNLVRLFVKYYSESPDVESLHRLMVSDVPNHNLGVQRAFRKKVSAILGNDRMMGVDTLLKQAIQNIESEEIGKEWEAFDTPAAKTKEFVGILESLFTGTPNQRSSLLYKGNWATLQLDPSLPKDKQREARKKAYQAILDHHSEYLPDLLELIVKYPNKRSGKDRGVGAFEKSMEKRGLPKEITSVLAEGGGRFDPILWKEALRRRSLELHKKIDRQERDLPTGQTEALRDLNEELELYRKIGIKIPYNIMWEAKTPDGNTFQVLERPPPKKGEDTVFQRIVDPQSGKTIENIGTHINLKSAIKGSIKYTDPKAYQALITGVSQPPISDKAYSRKMKDKWENLLPSYLQMEERKIGLSTRLGFF